jgi:tetratricopeptide (TPR) repeat protein
VKRESQRQRIKRLLQTVEEQPQRASAHYNLGLAYTTSGRVKLAAEAYEKALELDPDLVEAWVNLGGVRLLHWDFQACLEANQEAVARQPDLVQAHFNMGQAYLYLNEPERLLECNKRVIELDRNHGAAHYFAAVAQLALDNLGAAERHLGRAQELGHQPPQDFIKALNKAREQKARRSGANLIEISGAKAPDKDKED